MMKRTGAWMLALVLVLALAVTGCSSGDKNGTEADTAGPVSTEATSPYRDDVAVSDIRDAVAEAYGENYLPSMALDAESLASLYGVTEDMYDEFVAEMPMISVHVDTLIVVKAKPDRVEDVKAALENYRTYQIEEGMNYPMNVPKIEASEVVEYGNYVCYIMLGMIDDSLRDDEAAMLAAFQEQNQIAKNCIEQMLAQ